ncbi:MAG: ABC transporter permease [Treponema sp.]|nr:ABC transporter permease [Treponema sp.]
MPDMFDMLKTKAGSAMAFPARAWRTLRPALVSARRAGGRFLEVFSGSDVLVSVAVVLLGFLVATLILMAIDRNPLGLYQAIVRVTTGFDLRRWGDWDMLMRTRNLFPVGEWLLVSSPLILCGLSMGFAARAGLFNIGAEGQYIAGVTASQVIAFMFPPIPGLHAIVAVCGGIAAGAAWGGIAGFFKARFRVSEVVATIMMNHIALFFHQIITLRLPDARPDRMPAFPETATIASPFLSGLTNGSRLNHGIWLTLIAIVVFWIIMGKTRLGYSLRATGLNRDAAHYGGINVKANITTAMAIAGGFAGLAGAAVSLGMFPSGRVLPAFEGYGFEGIAVALVGNSTAWGTALSGLLFGMLRSAQPIMQLWYQIPREITSIIVGMVVIFISLRAGLRLISDWRMKEKIRLSNAEREHDAGDSADGDVSGDGTRGGG